MINLERFFTLNFSVRIPKLIKILDMNVDRILMNSFFGCNCHNPKCSLKHPFEINDIQYACHITIPLTLLSCQKCKSAWLPLMFAN